MNYPWVLPLFDYYVVYEDQSIKLGRYWYPEINDL